jgi:hypothetical protein
MVQATTYTYFDHLKIGPDFRQPGKVKKKLLLNKDKNTDKTVLNLDH